MNASGCGDQTLRTLPPRHRPRKPQASGKRPILPAPLGGAKLGVRFPHDGAPVISAGAREQSRHRRKSLGSILSATVSNPLPAFIA